MLLSRINSIGGIDVNTPAIILLEIASFMNIKLATTKITNQQYRSRVITTLIKHDDTKINKPYTVTDLQKLAQYINRDPRIVWSTKTLLTAHSFLLRLDQITPANVRKILSPNITFGSLTPQTPNTIDLISLYAILSKLNIIPTNTSDTLSLSEIWSSQLRNYLETDHYLMKREIISNLDLCAPATIFNLYSKIKRLKNIAPVPKIDLNLLESIYKKEKLKSKALDKEENTPKTNEEAIVLAAVYYSLDLLSVRDPILVYYKLVENPRYRNSFKKINQHFNSNLPRCFYSDAVIQRIASDLGFSNKNIKSSDPYQLCLEAQHLNQFKHGKRRTHSNEKTHVYLTSIKDLSYHQCVSFGLKNTPRREVSKLRYFIYTYTELLITFSTYLDFVPPNKSDAISFTPRDIRRLLHLSTHHQYFGESDDAYRVRIQLATKIKQIKSSRKQLSAAEKMLLVYIKDEETKVEIEKVLILFTEAVMYMRGWLGPPNDYPLADTLVKDQDQVDMLVGVNLSKMCLYLKERNIVNLIYDLPLYQYNQGCYVRNIDKEKGLTIGERLSILENKDNINSCIRTSSNWFLASISKYYTLIGALSPFEIDDVRRIG